MNREDFARFMIISRVAEWFADTQPNSSNISENFHGQIFWIYVNFTVQHNEEVSLFHIRETKALHFEGSKFDIESHYNKNILLRYSHVKETVSIQELL